MKTKLDRVGGGDDDDGGDDNDDDDDDDVVVVSERERVTPPSGEFPLESWEGRIREGR